MGGSALAAQAFTAGLVDECHLFITPVIVVGGTPALPDGLRVALDPLDERRLRNGVVTSTTALPRDERRLSPVRRAENGPPPRRRR